MEDDEINFSPTSISDLHNEESLQNTSHSSYLN